MSNRPFIVISGNVGTGKSTLADALARRLSTTAYLERPEANPYFNRNPPLTFHAEACFLAESIEATRAITTGRGGVQERSVAEQIAVFARAHYLNGRLDPDELKLLERLSAASDAAIAKPDHLLYLHAKPSTLLMRIRERKRPGEESVNLAYLRQLGDLYEAFLAKWDACPILRLDADMVDFRNTEAIGQVVQRMGREQ